MRKKSKNKIKKKTLKKKRRIKANSGKTSRNKSMDLQKIVGFKFQTLNKAYENFKTKRRKEREKQEKSKIKNREKQIKEEQKQLKEEEKQLKKEEENRLKEVNIIRIEPRKKGKRGTGGAGKN